MAIIASMVGIDLTTISRFEKPTSALIRRILHPQEIADYQQSPAKSLFLAQRWAIKEALYKADNQYYHFNRVKIARVGRVFKVPGFVVSTSREGDQCVAIVIKEF
ncbi:4'-phosphopantetheinyl transferase superfamily protein [Mycoplasma sp. ATU-Cv-703]|uniref:4'-phosphopantetheinyl transferase superfamily protein n=1 Tax=Mycoplasma sp. ATU-Cv-703 TaxID=2498595 RepID=UPI001F0162A7